MPERDPHTTGIYIHFPYCIQKCHYCDFYSVGLNPDGRSAVRRPDARQFAEFFDAIRIEFESRLRQAGDASTDFRRFSRVNTVFFGGGTASLMPVELIERLLALFRSEFEITADAEITLEGNPENFLPDYLSGLHSIGVNRVNAGLQTFHTDLLDDMNRFYERERYAAVLEHLAGCPIERIGGDLIYGFDRQTEAQFYDDLRASAQAGVNHLSIYSLTLESNTPYAGHVRQGRMRPPRDELQARIFERLPAIMHELGFAHYEVSNFARPGNECRHNLRYWLYESYLGLGPGAHGFDGRYRYGNSRSVANWRNDPAGAPFQKHAPLEELPLVYLRLCDGLSADVIREVLVAEGGYPERVADRAAALIAAWEARAYGETTPLMMRDGGRLPPEKALREFRWNMSGLLQLDDRVFEMCDALETAADAPGHD